MCFSCVLIVLGALHGDALLVQPAQLASLPDALPVDVRSAEAFDAGHVPGAAHLDVDSLSETRDGVPGLLKSVDIVREAIAGAGISPDKHLVVYASADSLKSATRVLWILEYLGYPRVSVLDGGYEHWLEQGTSPAKGDSSVDAVPLVALPDELRSELLASKDEVRAAGCTLVDLRSSEEFSGTSKKDFVKQSGHIPDAKSLPAGDLVEGDMPLFKPTGVIAELLRGQGGNDNGRVVTYCNTGRDATIGYLAYRLAGHENVAVYDGSMAEWAQDGAVVDEKH